MTPEKKEIQKQNNNPILNKAKLDINYVSQIEYSKINTGIKLSQLSSELDIENAKIVSFLPKNITLEDTKNLLKDFKSWKEKNNLKLQSGDIFTIKKGVFYILRDSKPIYYQKIKNFKKVETKNLSDSDKIKNFLSGKKINNKKIEEILNKLRESGIKLEKDDEIKFSSGVFYILRDSKPIFYEATDKISTTFGEKDEQYIVGENFLETKKDIDTIEKELEKLVEFSTDELLAGDKEKETKKVEVKKLAKQELKENITKAKEIVKSEKIQKSSDFVSKYCKMVGLKTINPEEIKSLGFFESYFNDKSISSGKAKGRYQITETAHKQARKEVNFKLGNLKNPTYNTLVCVSYLKWIEKYFLEDSNKNEGRKIINSIKGKYYKNSYEIVGKYLKKKNIEIDKNNFDKLLSEINKESYLNKFLVLRKYNADSSKNPGEILEHKNYYALVILYLSLFEKKEVAEVMRQKRIG